MRNLSGTAARSMSIMPPASIPLETCGDAPRKRECLIFRETSQMLFNMSRNFGRIRQSPMGIAMPNPKVRPIYSPAFLARAVPAQAVLSAAT